MFMLFIRYLYNRWFYKCSINVIEYTDDCSGTSDDKSKDGENSADNLPYDQVKQIIDIA